MMFKKRIKWQLCIVMITYTYIDIVFVYTMYNIQYLSHMSKIQSKDMHSSIRNQYKKFHTIMLVGDKTGDVHSINRIKKKSI